MSSPSVGGTNLDGALVVRASVLSGPASYLLSLEGLRYRSRHAILAITENKLDYATLDPGDFSMDGPGCSVDPVQPSPRSTEVDFLANPIIEEPVTPPAPSIACYPSTADLTVEYLEDKPRVSGTRGLLLGYEDSSLTSLVPVGS